MRVLAINGISRKNRDVTITLITIDKLNHFLLNHKMFVVGSTYWNRAYSKKIGA